MLFMLCYVMLYYIILYCIVLYWWYWIPGTFQTHDIELVQACARAPWSCLIPKLQNIPLDFACQNPFHSRAAEAGVRHMTRRKDLGWDGLEAKLFFLKGFNNV